MFDKAFSGFRRAVVIDVETTGFSPRKDRIVSVAAIKADFAEATRQGGSTVTTYKCLVNPGIPIPKAASNVHGIFDHHVATEEAFLDIAATLQDFMEDLPVIAHNCEFDSSFINAEFSRCSLRAIPSSRLYCTMRRMVHHNRRSGFGSKPPKLEEAARLLSIPFARAGYHDAMEDALAAYQVAAALYRLDNRL